MRKALSTDNLDEDFEKFVSQDLVGILCDYVHSSEKYNSDHIDLAYEVLLKNLTLIPHS